MRSGVARRAARGVLCLLVAAELLCWALPMHAQSTVIRTRKRPSETGSPLHPFTLGAGLEFQTDSEETELNVPLVVDYNVRDFLLIHVEPNFVYIDRKQNGEANLAGVGDLETSLDAELLRERRYTPSLTAQAGVRWPTASRSAAGDPGIDCLLGLGFAKDLVFVELDSSFVYTFATSSHL